MCWTNYSLKRLDHHDIANVTAAPIGAGVLPNGDIVVGGGAGALTVNSSGIEPTTFFLVAYTSNGALDTTFGSKGIVNLVVGSENESVGPLMVQPNGQIILAGNEPGLSKKQAPSTVLIRFNENGSLDTTFGTGGIVQVATAVAPGPGTIALLSNGDYLAIGAGKTQKRSSVLAVPCWRRSRPPALVLLERTRRRFSKRVAISLPLRPSRHPLRARPQG